MPVYNVHFIVLNVVAFSEEDAIAFADAHKEFDCVWAEEEKENT